MCFVSFVFSPYCSMRPIFSSHNDVGVTKSHLLALTLFFDKCQNFVSN